MSEKESGLPELNALAGEAAIADTQAAPTAAPENVALVPGVQQVDRLAEAAMLIAIFRPMTEMAVTYIKGAPDTEWQALHQPVADLLAYYDVDVSKWLNSPWAALAFASVPLVMRGVNNWQEAEEKKQKKIAAPETTAPLAVDPAPVAAPCEPRG